MAWMIDGITANDPVSDLKALLKSGEAVPVPVSEGGPAIR